MEVVMTWDKFIKEEMKKDYFKKIIAYLKHENYYPHPNEIFNAFKMTPYDKVKVVIIGQDPYHEEGQAHGLAFSVLNNQAPPSLKNIFKEIYDDTGHIRSNPNLSDWASQGVLLLNATLTCKCHMANSHKDIGWQVFTDNVIRELNKKEESIVYILWGGFAKSKINLIDKHHYIITSAHPSPLSAYNGFFGSKPFSKCNDFLVKQGQEPIKWWD